MNAEERSESNYVPNQKWKAAACFWESNKVIPLEAPVFEARFLVAIIFCAMSSSTLQ